MVNRAPMVARAAVLGIMAVGLVQVVSLIPARAQGRKASVWVTSGDRSRLVQQQPDVPIVSDTTSTNLTIDVRADQAFQQIEGFGASLTESSAWLMATALTDGERATLMTHFFHPVAGIGLDVLRQPIGASDFSLSHYSYDDMPAGQRDPLLQQFSIARDRTYVIPAVRQAIQLNPGLRVMATPWSPPGWMKTTGSMLRGGLKPENFAPYATYFVKFLQAYAAEGIPVDTVTVQNEPHFTPEDYPGMYMTSADQVTFVRDYLAPAFSQAHLTTRILAFDHNWNEPNYPLEVFSDAGARASIAGSAFHCYAGNPSVMASVHASHPDKSIHVTECSLFAGTTPTFTDSLIWTTRALLIGSLRNWAQTVITWNLALDQQYGPHTGGCPDCTGLATIDRGTGNVTLNGEFYALGHVSKFVQRGAYRIESTTLGTQGVDDVAFRNPDGSYVLVVSNSWQTGAIKVRFGSESFTFALPPGSVATFTWPGGAPPPPGQAIPGRIEAESFNDGGEGRAYHDSTAGNTGGQYRSTDVDLEVTSDVGGGYNVGWMKAGEWLEYSIDVAKAGTFTVEARVASNGPGGSFHIEVNGIDKTGRMTIPDTRGWQSWATLTRTDVALAAGAQRLRVIVDTNGATGDAGNFNYLHFSAANPTQPPIASTPFGGTPTAVPGTIEAENFDNGGESVAYHDLSAGNSGGQYRAGDVDIQGTTDTGGGYNIGWLAVGEWLKYTVNVTTAGTYTLDVRVAANGAGGTFHVEANGVNLTGPLVFTDTGSWQAWRLVTKSRVTLGAGVQVLRLVVDAAGPTGIVGNINHLRLTRAGGAPGSTNLALGRLASSSSTYSASLSTRRKRSTAPRAHDGQAHLQIRNGSRLTSGQPAPSRAWSSGGRLPTAPTIKFRFQTTTPHGRQSGRSSVRMEASTTSRGFWAPAAMFACPARAAARCGAIRSGSSRSTAPHRDPRDGTARMPLSEESASLRAISPDVLQR